MLCFSADIELPGSRQKDDCQEDSHKDPAKIVRHEVMALYLLTTECIPIAVAEIGGDYCIVFNDQIGTVDQTADRRKKSEDVPQIVK